MVTLLELDEFECARGGTGGAEQQVGAAERETTYTVPLGGGLAAVIPHGTGRPSLRWHAWADRMLQHLRDLTAARGTALEARQATPPLPSRNTDDSSATTDPSTATETGISRNTATAPDTGNAANEDHADSAWIEVRIIDGALPIDCMLGHPSLARILHIALNNHLGAPPAIYRQPGRVLACPTPHATPLPEWTGPFDLATGFCHPLTPQN